MKKRALSLLLALVLILGLVPGTASAAAEPIELSVWAAENDSGWLQDRLAAFEAANPQWSITWNLGVCSAYDALSMVSYDPYAAADVYFYSNDAFHTLRDLGALLPLSNSEAAAARENSTEQLMNTVRDINGTCYGYPVSSNTWFMYYNKSIFSEEDVKSLETMLEKGTVAFPLNNSWYLPGFYFANGCSLFGEYGNDAAAGADFGGEKAADVTLRLLELMEHPNFALDSDGSGNFDLKTGTVGAYFSGSWDYAGLKNALGDDLGAAPAPTFRINGTDKQIRPYLGSQAIGVNGYTDHAAAARALAQFLSSEESQLQRWNATGTIPAAASLSSDSSITAHVAAAAQIDSCSIARVQPTITEMNACWGPIGTFGFSLCDGEISPENAAEMTELLNRQLNGEDVILEVPTYTYEVYEDHVEITGYTGSPEVLEIPAEIEGLPVTAIAPDAFFYCTSLTQITLPDTITSIGDWAFQDCPSLTEITIPENVTDIGWYAFYNCNSLTSVTIPASVLTIGGGCFGHCDNLTKICVEEGNPHYCDQDGVLYTKDMTELLCVPGTTAGSFTIPASVYYLDNAFNGCHALTEILVEAGNEVYVSQDGILYTLEKDWLVRCPGGREGHVTIPSSVCAIGYDAFADCALLTGVTIPDSVTDIESSAFWGCSSLTSVVIPDSVVYMGGSTFAYCTNLASVKLPAGLDYIPFNSFFNCTSLTEFTIPSGVAGIESSAFENCTNLTSVTIPSGVTYIGEWAFYNCSSLTSVTIPDSVTEIGWATFAWSGLTSIKFEGNAPQFGEWVFEGVTATAYYPVGNTTWTADVMQDYNGTITWVPYDSNNPFTDVKEGSFCYEPILWAVEKGITSGMGNGTFAPNNQCTRGQVVTFLWRAAGKPEPTVTSHPFTDVKEGAYYYKAMLWAVENKITSGMTATTFGPDAVCNRGQVVTFLHRAKGKPAPTVTSHPFTDVNEKGFYYTAMLWAVENGITSGMSATTFNPDNACTRGQVVTFLYRAYAK